MNPWRVEKFRVGGVSFWQAYRLKVPGKPDEEGNREYAGPIFDTKDEATIWLHENLETMPE